MIRTSRWGRSSGRPLRDRPILGRGIHRQFTSRPPVVGDLRSAPVARKGVCTRSAEIGRGPHDANLRDSTRTGAGPAERPPLDLKGAVLAARFSIRGDG